MFPMQQTVDCNYTSQRGNLLHLVLIGMHLCLNAPVAINAPNFVVGINAPTAWSVCPTDTITVKHMYTKKLTYISILHKNNTCITSQLLPSRHTMLWQRCNNVRHQRFDDVEFLVDMKVESTSDINVVSTSCIDVVSTSGSNVVTTLQQQQRCNSAAALISALGPMTALSGVKPKLVVCLNQTGNVV